MAGRAISPEVVREIRHMRREGCTTVQTAAALNVSYATVRNYSGGSFKGRGAGSPEPPSWDIPKDTRDFTGQFCGDPLPGRSALDRKQESR